MLIIIVAAIVTIIVVVIVVVTIVIVVVSFYWRGAHQKCLESIPSSEVTPGGVEAVPGIYQGSAACKASANFCTISHAFSPLWSMLTLMGCCNIPFSFPGEL